MRPRKLTTRVGPLTLRVPQVRDGEFSTELFARYQRSEQALVLALMEMVVNGVSTRKVTQITEELCGASFSKSTVSALCAQLDPLVTAWNERPLGEQAFPFVLVDALVLKVREDERVRALSGLLAIGVNAARLARDSGAAARRQRVGSQLVGVPRLAQAARPLRRGSGRLRCPWRIGQRDPAPLPGRDLAALSDAL